MTSESPCTTHARMRVTVWLSCCLDTEYILFDCRASAYCIRTHASDCAKATDCRGLYLSWSSVTGTIVDQSRRCSQAVKALHCQGTIVFLKYAFRKLQKEAYRFQQIRAMRQAPSSVSNLERIACEKRREVTSRHALRRVMT